MVKKSGENACCGSSCEGMGGCKVEAVISVDERGQMVLPKEMRDKADIRAGDKLALVSWEKDEKVCCLILIKAGDFGEMVKGFLGPMMQEIMPRDTRE